MEEALSFINMYSLLRPECKESLLNVIAKMIITRSKQVEIPDCINEKQINMVIDIEDCLITKVLKEEKFLEKLEDEENARESFDILESRLTPFPECMLCLSKVIGFFHKNQPFDIKDLNCLHVFRAKEN